MAPHYEEPGREPAVLPDLAKALGVSVDELMGGDRPPATQADHAADRYLHRSRAAKAKG